MSPVVWIIIGCAVLYLIRLMFRLYVEGQTKARDPRQQLVVLRRDYGQLFYNWTVLVKTAFSLADPVSAAELKRRIPLTLLDDVRELNKRDPDQDRRMFMACSCSVIDRALLTDEETTLAEIKKIQKHVEWMFERVLGELYPGGPSYQQWEDASVAEFEARKTIQRKSN